jgi:GntR family transcriptional regulator, transcriptional repressor for pyruvate dehydrogenase complex
VAFKRHVGTRLVAKKDLKGLHPSEVLEHLRQVIASGKMPPGTRMPSERTLAIELGVGRQAVREAFKALQVLDVIDIRHGDGTYIKSLAGLAGGWPAKIEIIREDFDLIELLEVRKMFEPKAAALAAARRDAKKLAKIEHELREQEKRPDDRELLIRHDYLFHEAIINAAENKVLANVARSLAPLLVRSRKLTAQTTPDIRKVIHQHRTIFEAIRLGEVDLAEHAMREHLQTAGLDLLSHKAQPRLVEEA